VSIERKDCGFARKMKLLHGVSAASRKEWVKVVRDASGVSSRLLRGAEPEVNALDYSEGRM
jgi:hypothetical protein